MMITKVTIKTWVMLRITSITMVRVVTIIGSMLNVMMTMTRIIMLIIRKITVGSEMLTSATDNHIIAACSVSNLTVLF